MNYWLLKTEPEEYSYDDLIKSKEGIWDGVRNYQARNNLNTINEDDLILIYHTGNEKAIVGIAKSSHKAFPDPSDPTETWVAIKLVPYKKLNKSVSLQEIKHDSFFSDFALIKQSRLSVMPVSKVHFHRIIEMGNTDII